MVTWGRGGASPPRPRGPALPRSPPPTPRTHAQGGLLGFPGETQREGGTRSGRGNTRLVAPPRPPARHLSASRRSGKSRCCGLLARSPRKVGASTAMPLTRGALSMAGPRGPGWAVQCQVPSPYGAPQGLGHVAENCYLGGTFLGGWYDLCLHPHGTPELGLETMPYLDHGTRASDCPMRAWAGGRSGRCWHWQSRLQPFL